MRWLPMLALFSTPAVAIADPDDDLDFLEAEPAPKTNESIEDFDSIDELEFEEGAFRAPPPGAVTDPVGLAVLGKSVLAGNYPLAVVAAEPAAVLVELPVLVAKSRADVETPFELRVTFVVDEGAPVVHSERWAPALVPRSGPAWSFFKVLLPAGRESGAITATVTRHVEGAEQPEALFETTVGYALRPSVP